MSSEQLVESFCRLISKLDVVPDNKESCRELKKIYRSIVASDNTDKKNDVSEQLDDIIRPIYRKYRDIIIVKDFSFLLSDKNVLVVDNHDIGSLYSNALDSDDDNHINIIANELLFLFYQVAPAKDQKLIDDKYRKVSKKKEPSTNTPTTPNLTKQMEKLLEKNKGKLKRAEKDPSVIPDVLSELFQNNSRDMADLLTGMLGTMGIDPAQMNGSK